MAHNNNPDDGGTLPEIGAAWRGGIYAGITVHNNQPMTLVLLPGDVRKTWNEAVAWATEQGRELPSRMDMLVLFQNLKREFQESCYWTGARYARIGCYAWYQSFTHGNQDINHEVSALRARAVRRFPIKPYTPPDSGEVGRLRDALDHIMRVAREGIHPTRRLDWLAEGKK